MTDYVAFHTKCGSEEVYYREMSVSYLPIAVYKDKDGTLYPEADIDDADTVVEESILWCNECDHSFPKEELDFRDENEEAVQPDPVDDL